MIVSNVASMDGRPTLAPGVDLMAGDERWSAMMGDLADPYAWVRASHDPHVLLEGSGSLLNPVGAVVQDAEPGPAPEGEHFLPDDVVGVAGRRWFALVDGAGRVDSDAITAAGNAETATKSTGSSTASKPILTTSAKRGQRYPRPTSSCEGGSRPGTAWPGIAPVNCETRWSLCRRLRVGCGRAAAGSL